MRGRRSVRGLATQLVEDLLKLVASRDGVLKLPTVLQKLAVDPLRDPGSLPATCDKPALAEPKPREYVDDLIVLGRSLLRIASACRHSWIS